MSLSKRLDERRSKIEELINNSSNNKTLPFQKNNSSMKIRQKSRMSIRIYNIHHLTYVKHNPKFSITILRGTI